MIDFNRLLLFKDPTNTYALYEVVTYALRDKSLRDKVKEPNNKDNKVCTISLEVVNLDDLSCCEIILTPTHFSKEKDYPFNDDEFEIYKIAEYDDSSIEIKIEINDKCSIKAADDYQSEIEYAINFSNRVLKYIYENWRDDLGGGRSRCYLSGNLEDLNTK